MLVVRNVCLEHRETFLLRYLDIPLLAGVRLDRIDPSGRIKADVPSLATGRIRVGRVDGDNSLGSGAECRHLLQGLIASLPDPLLRDQRLSTNNYQAGNTAHAGTQMNTSQHPTPLQEPAQVLARASTAIFFLNTLIPNMRFPPPHLASLACWFLLFSSGAAEGQNNSTGLVEIDLVFPRNETYNPSPLMPIVFSYRNTGLIPLLNPTVSYEFWPYNDNSGPGITGRQEVLVNHTSTDPYLKHSFYLFPFDTEGIWSLAFRVSWTNCYGGGSDFDPEQALRVNNTELGIIFTTKGPSKQIDLVAATNNQTCAAPAGVAINITGAVDTQNEGFEGDLCAVVTSPPTEAESCAVTIGAAAASSISASMTSDVCKWRAATDVPDGVDCSSFKSKSLALQIVPGAATCLAFMLGALGFIL